MFEFLFGFLGEITLQLLLEGLTELGLRSVSEPFRRPPNPWIAAVGYSLFGAVVGGLSLLIFPAHLVATHDLRLLNLAITPVLVGLVMCALGAWRKRRGDTLLRIDRFAYGYLFALAIALVRFYFAD